MKIFTIGNVKADLSCCRGTRSGKSGESDDDNDEEDDDDLLEHRHTVTDFESVSDFSESEVEKLEVLDAFFEEHTRKEFSSKAKTALEYVFSEFVGTPVENDMYLFKQRIIENFQIYSEWYQSQSSIIEDIGLICLPEGEKTYPAKQQQQHYFFVKFNSL